MTAPPTPPKPLDPPMVPFAIGGIVLWIITALVMLPFRDELAAHGHGNWFGIAVAGAIWGIPGLSFMLIHDRNRRRRRARAGIGTSDSFKTDASAAP
ncbi:hypothetical protein GCM10020218_073320 [Dactylosporangium vinaceum]|uniref:DUF2530 domain-containing protein n=2 Tax=Dactylosporangium vinaceum TaxID=53362 RepID=A0ABV5M4L1_9ACTN